MNSMDKNNDRKITDRIEDNQSLINDLFALLLTKDRLTEDITENINHELGDLKRGVGSGFASCVQTGQMKSVLIENLALREELALAERTLSDFKKILENRDRLFSIIAHDLRGPANNIVCIVDTLGESIENNGYSKMSRPIELLSRSAYSMKHLLDNLLNWARLQGGKIIFSPKEIEIIPLIYESVEIVSATALLKKIVIQVDQTNSARLMADESMLKVILYNLLSNSIKFTYSGGLITIRIWIADGSCRISIKDNGIGMDDEMCANLFIDTNAVSRYGTNGEPGSGLGLRLCKDFIDLHCGGIEVSSKLGSGSKFIISLPIKGKDTTKNNKAH
ncbi:sensor histidine kinase [Maribacter litoralis]|uniref:sensor histidine kinase n=2 Tax=Maribacter TaxID=252356 RepID=UPI000E30CA0B|nr:HAMP domain-containing sensor histidine kinase [Maribacter litoralis]|tara:strand:+ start:2886 stop:3887 length:1002 start_codon:yes stop_codon:yes gene_type:complete